MQKRTGLVYPTNKQFNFMFLLPNLSNNILSQYFMTMEFEWSNRNINYEVLQGTNFLCYEVQIIWSGTSEKNSITRYFELCLEKYVIVYFQE